MPWNVYITNKEGVVKLSSEGSTTKAKAVRKLKRLNKVGLTGLATVKVLDHNGEPVDGEPLNNENTLRL